MDNNKNLSPRGIAVKQFKKAALAFDKNVSNGIEYDMVKLIEEDANKRAKFDLKLNLISGIKDLQLQYKRLFEDYASISGKFNEEEFPFNVVLDNKESAYNKATDLINLLSNTIL